MQLQRFETGLIHLELPKYFKDGLWRLTLVLHFLAYSDPLSLSLLLFHFLCQVVWDYFECLGRRLSHLLSCRCCYWLRGTAAATAAAAPASTTWAPLFFFLFFSSCSQEKRGEAVLITLQIDSLAFLDCLRKKWNFIRREEKKESFSLLPFKIFSSSFLPLLPSSSGGRVVNKSWCSWKRKVLASWAGFQWLLLLLLHFLPAVLQKTEKEKSFMIFFLSY